jgi:hypothetical protein
MYKYIVIQSIDEFPMPTACRQSKAHAIFGAFKGISPLLFLIQVLQSWLHARLCKLVGQSRTP